MSDNLTPTGRTKIKRVPKHGNYDRAVIYKILDEAFICHVGFSDGNQPFVIPTSFARAGDTLLIHGSAASRMMRSLADGVDVCVAVTLVDGLVLARSAFHHSMNYRSVVVFGRASLIEGDAAKLDALKSLSDHIVPHRWSEVRKPTANELKATTVLSVSLQEASAKIRTGAPVDDAEDYALDIWAGVIPLSLKAGKPVDDARLKNGVRRSPSVVGFKLGR